MAEEVVEKAGIRGRAVAQLGFGKQLEHGRRQHVGGRMAVDLQRFGIAVGKQAQVHVFFQRLAEVGKLPAIFGCRSMHAGGNFLRDCFCSCLELIADC